ncbi:MAG: hypothetical protein SPF74_05515 [Candidatus Limivicinus sp.]|nr:hypothetical protein [Candidatus Limivicinus sp.]
MYQGRHSASGSPRADRPAASRRAGGSKKPLTLFVALVLLLTLAVGGSLAWLVSDDKVQNTMVPGEVPIQINETVSGTTKTSVTVTNNGNIQAFIRVAIIANAVDENGDVTVDTAPTYTVDSSKWTPIGDYYYYKGIVEPKGTDGNTTAPLFTGDVNFAGGEINILAESIQVLGGRQYDGSASVDAWGVVYNTTTNSWAPYTA